MTSAYHALLDALPADTRAWAERHPEAVQAMLAQLRPVVIAAYPYLSRTAHRGASVESDRVQDLIQALKDGDPAATRTVAGALSKHPTLAGFRGVIVPAPRSQSDRPSMARLAEALVAAGVGSSVADIVVRERPVESSRQRRRYGRAGVSEQEHHASIGLRALPPPTAPVLVVDDVVTTGSTLQAVARRLREAGHTGPILLAAGAAATSAREQGPIVRLPPAGVRPIYFASGASRAAEALAFADAGQPFGIAAGEASRAVEAAVIEARRRVPVFVDSGAFSEVVFGPAGITYDPKRAPDWARVLELYDRVSRTPGHPAYVVAPDRVADAVHTVRLWSEHASTLRALLSRPTVRLIVPLQRSGGWTLTTMWDRTLRLFGEHADRLVAGIPSKKDATSAAEFRTFLAESRDLPLPAVHFLGLGASADGAAERLADLRAARPGAQALFDSVYLRGKLGTRQRPGAYMRAKDAAGEALTEDRWQGRTVEDVEDPTDIWMDLGEWLRGPERKAVADAAGLRGDDRALFLRDPSAYLEEVEDASLDPRLHDAVEAAYARGAWAAETRERTRRAVGRVLEDDPKAGLWERFHATLPPKGRRVDVPPDIPDAAVQLLDACDRWMGEPEAHAVWLALDGGDVDGEAYDADDVSRDYTELFLADAGLDDTPHDRAVARFGWRLAMESDPERWTGQAYGDPVKMRRKGSTGAATRHRDDTRDGPLPRWLARAILADRLAEDAVKAAPGGLRLRLAPVGRDEAAAFIAQHHRELPEMPRRTMYALGAFRGDRLVAVATAGHPSGPWRRVDQRNVLECTRVASDGTTEGAASMLVARLLDAAPASRRGSTSEPWLFVTYSLSTEQGDTYRALRDKGLRPVEVIAGKRPGRQGARSAPPLGEQTKVRWEAGPAAMPAISLPGAGPSRR